MSQLLMIGSRFVVCRNGLARTGRLVTQSRQTGSSTLQQEASKFFERHAKRASPMSPYMFPFAYKFQITSVLSITHRITGLGLGVLLYGIGIAELCCSNLSFEQILQKLQAVPSSLFSAAKVAAGKKHITLKQKFVFNICFIRYRNCFSHLQRRSSSCLGRRLRFCY